jgi:hypothetical protein
MVMLVSVKESIGVCATREDAELLKLGVGDENELVSFGKCARSLLCVVGWAEQGPSDVGKRDRCAMDNKIGGDNKRHFALGCGNRG